ncbi:MAG: PAS domain S-box protein [Candidatus Aminicenantes bacterium]|nr:PAS domain S-box protein [Candidatus Aminicenantes bacterium]
MKTKKSSKTKLRVLFLEDLPQDIEIIRELLMEAEFDLDYDRTDSEKEFLKLLHGRTYDVILADFKLPGFDAFTALRWSKEICPDVPFICVSGTIGEETAVEVLKQGAVDYVLKDRMGRLTFAIKRALAEAMERKKIKRAEKTLRESEERYQNLAMISPVGIFRTDSNGHTTYVNPMWCQISGLSFAEALDSGWLKAVHEDDRDRLSKDWQETARLHKTSFTDYRFLRPDGTVAWVMGQASPEMNLENQFVGYVGTITDISERKRAEEMIRSSLEEKEVLLKEVHHRVKNNLMTLIGLIKMQEAKADNVTFSDLLQELEGRVRAMAQVHENLHKSKDLARVNLQDYIETMSAHIRAQYGAECDIRVSLQAAGVEVNLDIAVPCGLILNELLTNAFKHAFPGDKPRTGTDNCEINVTMVKENGTLMLTVADNGVGLPADFEWEKSETLGLQLVKMLIKQINGSIELECSAGIAFRLKFPVAVT